jgi:N-acetylmuramoyl-L-alanine amidase
MIRLASEHFFRKIPAALALPMCLILLANCAKEEVCISYPAQSRSAPSPQAPPPPSKTTPQLAERSLADLGAPRTVYHEVGPLESVWRIAKMYDVTPESICAANGLKPGEPLRTGQKLVIPNTRSLRQVVPLYPNRQWRYIIVHHTATDIGNAKLLDKSHEDRGFWNGLGYHFLIDNGTLGKGDGLIEVAPRWIRQQSGAHCKAGGMNERGIGVALVGNFSEAGPTPDQMVALGYLLKTLCKYYKIPYGNVRGHREVEGAATECPGKKFPMIRVRQLLSSY